MKKLLILLFFCPFSIIFARGQTPINDPNWNTTTLAFNQSFIDVLPDLNTIWQPNITGVQSLLYHRDGGLPCLYDTVLYTLDFRNMERSPGGLKFIAKYSATQTCAKRIEYLQATDTLCDNRVNWQCFNYTSSALTSRSNYKYGYFEAKITLPKAKGLFPAFWLRSISADEEIDIMEMTGWQSEQAAIYQCNVYGSTAALQTRDTVGPFTDLSLTEHTFAAEWTRGRVTYFLDGVPVLMRSGQPGGYVAQTFCEIVLNLSVNPWGTIISPPGDKTMFVKSVKVYNFKTQNGYITSIPDYSTFDYKVYTTYVLNSYVNASNVCLRATDLIQFNSGFEVPTNTNFYAITTKLN